MVVIKENCVICKKGASKLVFVGGGYFSVCSNDLKTIEASIGEIEPITTPRSSLFGGSFSLL